MAKVIGILTALALHALFLLFGGLLLPEAAPHGNYQEVDLMSDEDVEKEPEPEPQEPEVRTPQETPPDAADVLAQLDQPVADATPALDAASLGALSDALMGRGGADGGFAGAVGFASGGRIGGTGVAGALGKEVEAAFSMSELDQKPRVVHQVDPTYPPSMRGRRLEGVVVVIFVVDATGKVGDARVEKASAPAFEQPAVDAVKRWRFEPGVRAGKRVPSKMRVSIRFPAM